MEVSRIDITGKRDYFIAVERSLFKELFVAEEDAKEVTSFEVRMFSLQVTILAKQYDCSDFIQEDREVRF